MEFDRADKPEAETALAAGHKEKKLNKRRKKPSKTPVSLKAAEKKPAEPKSLRETWEELVTNKHDRKAEKKLHKKPNKQAETAAEETATTDTKESIKKTKPQEKPAETIDTVELELYEEFEIPLSENAEVEIPLHSNAQEPHERPQDNQVAHEDPAMAIIPSEPWVEAIPPPTQSAEAPHGEHKEADIVAESAPATEVINNSDRVSDDQTVAEIISQVHAAYGKTEPIDKNLFNEAVDDSGSGGHDIVETAKSANHQADAKESLFAEPLDWRQKNKVKKIVRAEQREQEARTDKLEKSQKKTQKELAATRAQGLSNEEYWHHKLATQPAQFKSRELPRSISGPAAKSRTSRPNSTETQEVMERAQLSPEHHIEQSAWHSIEVDNKTGRAVERPAVITYGEAFKREKRQEALNAEEPEEVATASGQLAVGNITNVSVPEPSLSYSSQNPLRTPTLLGAANNTIRLGRGMSSTGGDLWLWLILGLIIVAIIASLKF